MKKEICRRLLENKFISLDEYDILMAEDKIVIHKETTVVKDSTAPITTPSLSEPYIPFYPPIIY